MTFGKIGSNSPNKWDYIVIPRGEKGKMLEPLMVHGLTAERAVEEFRKNYKQADAQAASYVVVSTDDVREFRMKTVTNEIVSEVHV